MKRIEIQLSKKKNVLAMLGAVCFILLGSIFVINPEIFAPQVFGSVDTVILIGIVSTSFFGICAFIIGKKLFDDNPGLIIEERGITDNSNMSSVGLIDWKDITGFETVQVHSTKIIIVLTNRPEKYLERAKSKLATKALKMNNKLYGSPISITPGTLKVKYDELEEQLRDAYNRYG